MKHMLYVNIYIHIRLICHLKLQNSLIINEKLVTYIIQIVLLSTYNDLSNVAQTRCLPVQILHAILMSDVLIWTTWPKKMKE